MEITDMIPTGLKRAIGIKIVRWAGTVAGASIAGFIFAHANVLSVLNQACASISSPETMTAAIGAAAVTVFTLFSSIKDARKVDAKVTVAAAAGVSEGAAMVHARQEGADTQLRTDQALVNAVSNAIATADKAVPADKASIVSSLKAGTF